MAEYIDREALLERIDGIWDCNDMVFRPNDHCCNVPEDCKGCKWAETQDAIRRIVENVPAADVRPAVLCKDCKYNNHCLTQAFVEEESRVPFNRNTWFCADGERIKNADN